MLKAVGAKFKVILADALAIVVLAMLLLPMHSWLYGTSLLNMSEKSAAAAGSLSYDIQRRQTAAVPSDEIALVDISGIYGAAARAEIAAVLDTIYSMGPKRIGVDVFFPTSSTTLSKDTEIQRQLTAQTDSILATTARHIADKTVFVCHLDLFDTDRRQFHKVDHSFFCNTTTVNDSMRLIEGYANLMQDDPGKPISKYTLSQQAEGGQVRSFAAQLVADYMDEGDFSDNEPIIRFEPTDFPCMAHNQLARDSIRDRIVLVGDMRDRGDSHLTPLGMMQGVEIHAYAVQTILHHDGMAGASLWLLMLISLVVCLLYAFTILFIDFKLDVKSNSLLKFVIKQSLFTLGVTYILNLILQYIAYVSFTVFDTTLGLHALLPDLIKLVAFTKVTYCIVVPLLYKRFRWKWLRYSCLIQ